MPANVKRGTYGGGFDTAVHMLPKNKQIMKHVVFLFLITK